MGYKRYISMYTMQTENRYFLWFSFSHLFIDILCFTIISFLWFSFYVMGLWYVLYKGSMENMNSLSVWVLLLMLEGMQICVLEESLEFKFLLFLIIILGAQVRQVRDVRIWFSIRFQSFVQLVSIKEKWNNQKHLRFSPRSVLLEKQNKLTSWAGAFSRIIFSNILSKRTTTVQLVEWILPVYDNHFIEVPIYLGHLA